MKLKEAPHNYEIQVGNIIEVDSKIFKKRQYEVHRVTAKYAFVKWNDKSQGKFPRTYNWAFQPYPKVSYPMVDYTVLIEDK